MYVGNGNIYIWEWKQEISKTYRRELFKLPSLTTSYGDRCFKIDLETQHLASQRKKK